MTNVNNVTFKMPCRDLTSLSHGSIRVSRYSIHWFTNAFSSAAVPTTFSNQTIYRAPSTMWWMTESNTLHRGWASIMCRSISCPYFIHFARYSYRLNGENLPGKQMRKISWYTLLWLDAKQELAFTGQKIDNSKKERKCFSWEFCQWILPVTSIFLAKFLQH